MKYLKLLIISLCINLCANTRTIINITKGMRAPTPIAIADISDNKNILKIVQRDLSSSGIINVISELIYPQNFSNKNIIIDYNSWKTIKALFLVIISKKDNIFNVTIYDVSRKTILSKDHIVFEKKNYRQVAHEISDIIYDKITGEAPYFTSKLVYIKENPNNLREKSIYMMDSDGENETCIVKGNNTYLSPRISNNKEFLTYFAYTSSYSKTKQKNIHTFGTIYLKTLNNKNIIKIDDQGVQFAPRFSNNSQKILYSKSINGNSYIFEKDLKSGKMTQLTYSIGMAIDTSPCFSPDDSKIVYNSDKNGKKHIYVMDSSGKNSIRISELTGGSYSTPVWSPRGDLIAFAYYEGGVSYLGVMKPDGTGVRLIDKGDLIESPTWTTNGRIITYTKYTRQYVKNSKSKFKFIPSIYSIDVTGYNIKILKRNASDPYWVNL